MRRYTVAEKNKLKAAYLKAHPEVGTLNCNPPRYYTYPVGGTYRDMTGTQLLKLAHDAREKRRNRKK
jgi:hypothetical protein